MIFKSWKNVIGRIDPVSEDTIRALPPMAWASKEHFQFRCGDVAHQFMQALPAEWREQRLVFFNRRERLERGWYPNSPHYHIDGLPPIGEGVHKYRDLECETEQIICCLGDVAPTAFVTGEIDLPEIQPGEKTFEVWSPEIARRIAAGELKEERIEPFTLVHFGYGSLHRSTAAVRTGYRYLIHCCRNGQVPLLNCEDFQVHLELTPRFRVKHNWEQDTRPDERM